MKDWLKFVNSLPPCSGCGVIAGECLCDSVGAERMKDLFKRHFIEQTLFPSKDKEQWFAYLILKEKYKHITYQSHDGYSCDGLADYTKNIVWVRNEIVDWTTKEVLLHTEKKFCECTSTEICTIWMRVNGETYKTKVEWLRTINSK